MKRLTCIDYQDSPTCRSLLYQSKEGFLTCSFELNAGNAYGVVSDFGYGGWGLVTCLGGRGSDDYSGELLLDGRHVTRDELSRRSCFVAENVFPSVNSEQDLSTPKACIEKALSLSGEPYTVSEIKELFLLTDNRFERPLGQLSGEIWLISMAVNFALGKEIFCYPWLNEFYISRYEIACEQGITDLLREKGKIILVPSSQKKTLKKLCDHIMIFSRGRFTFR